MAPYIIIVLAACAILCGSKLSLLPRAWRLGVIFPVAVLPYLAHPWLLRQSSHNLEHFMNSAPDLENLCVLAVTQELAALAVGWPLISGFCRHRKLRLLALTPSLLLFPGILYLQFSGFRFFPGVKFEYVTILTSLIGYAGMLLVAEIVAFHRNREDRIRLTLTWEWVVLLLTLSMPAVARFQGFVSPTAGSWNQQSVYVWGGVASLVVFFALISFIWQFIKEHIKGESNALFK